MHVLTFPVIQKQAAVLIAVSQFHPLLGKEIQDDPVSQFSQIPGEDQIIVIRACAGVAEEGGEGIVGCGSHGSAHIVGVRDPFVHHFSAGDMGDIRTGSAAAQNGAACGGGSPLRCGGALASIGHRHAVLPFCGAEMGAGHGGYGIGKSAVNEQSCQREGFSHGGAGAVEAVERNTKLPHTE